MAWRDVMWSVIRAMAQAAEEARALLAEAWRRLRRSAKGWSTEISVCCHISAELWALVSEALELPPLDGILPSVPGAIRPVRPEEVVSVLALVPPTARLVYLLDLLLGCPSAVLASLSGVPEGDIRAARSAVTWVMVGRRPQ